MEKVKVAGMDDMFVTEDDFAMFEKVRMSGATNMFDVKRVCELSGLALEQVMYIMRYYDELKQKFGANCM